MGRAGLWMGLGLAALGLPGLGCTSVDTEAPAEASPHVHDEYVYPATPAETPLPLKNAEYPGARYRQARYYTPGRRQAIDRIIIHTTEGRYNGTINWFRDPNNTFKTSAHYVIQSSDGEITQMVQEGDTAHHERTNNARSIGIEHEAFVAQSRWYTDAMYRSSAALVRYLCQKYNIPMDRQHILAHSETDPARRSDPGRHWDWDKYMGMVRNGADPTPTPGPDDGSRGGTCDNGNLWRCNFARTARERCEGGQIVATEACSAGCQVMAVGRDDVCRPSAGDAGQDWGACNAQGQPGTCMDTSACQGDAIAGFCPGGNNIQCCVRVPEPDPAPADPDPAPAPSVNGSACTVDGAQGQCVDLANAATCRAPAGLVYSATCGDAGACCVVLQGNDPAEPDPDPAPADPDPAPVNNGNGNAGAACDVWGTAGTCMTPADAQIRCAAATNELYIHPTCGTEDQALCCITVAGGGQDPAPDPNASEWENAPECDVGGDFGLCVRTATCAADGGYSTPGYCPGAADIQCCRWQ